MHGQGWAGASYWVPNSTVLSFFSNSHLVVARNEKKFPILVSYHFICLFRQTYVLLETIWTERVISLNHKLVKCLKKRPPFLIVTSSLIRKSRTSFCQLDFFKPKLYNWYTHQEFYYKANKRYLQLPMNKGQFCLSMGKSDKSIWQLALIVSLKIERKRGKKSYYFFHVFICTLLC